MDIQIEQTFTFRPDDLKEIIAEWVKRTQGLDVTPKDIQFHVENVTTGYGLGEHTSSVLTKATAVARPKQPTAETRAETKTHARSHQWEDPAFPNYTPK